ncbi:serine/threonine protein kinase [Glycomyces sp. A-F 0318]|uniref:serine/threonine-protein kinase n=1 Tax=Glycomyces amatae TaxID=2881355 RepID=UPI001E290E54|nr:serine/threonine-protein kinase [Glycomyces amatae]MCD0442127.1 serine/threonine protein kinase [Glycomyces amatae]
MQPLSPRDPDRIGPYRLIAELGRGAMGRVLLGHGPDGRTVAVKFVREQLAEDEEFRARFRREMAASQQVAGAYTAAVLDAGPDDPAPWLASEFLLGPTLRTAIDTTGPLPEATVLRLAAGLASALGSIHRAGIIHRDLKPGNVILAADAPRVIDFGIAHAVDRTRSDLTRTGGVIGTPEFMSPEQAESKPLTPASDVFALGSVLVAAATGASPFTGPSTFLTLSSVVRAEPDLDGLPPRLRAVAAPCLARRPEDRPAPAEVLALIGPVAPTSRPWPDAVAALADAQRRDLSRLLDGSGHDTTLIDSGPTMVSDPNRPTRVAEPHRPGAPTGTAPEGREHLADRQADRDRSAERPGSGRARAAPAKSWLGPAVLIALVVGAVALIPLLGPKLEPGGCVRLEEGDAYTAASLTEDEVDPIDCDDAVDYEDMRIAFQGSAPDDCGELASLAFDDDGDGSHTYYCLGIVGTNGAYWTESDAEEYASASEGT